MKYFIIPLLLIAKLSIAQTQFVPGYIILKNQNDTIKGTIEKKRWRFNPTEVSFNSSITVDRKYSINELSGFGIIGKLHYRVEKVDLDETPYSQNSIRTLPRTFIKKDTMLALRVLIGGEKSLYYLSDKKFKDHFFYSDSGITRELINIHHLKEKRERLYEVNLKHYQTQIGQLFKKCNQQIDFEQIKFEKESLVQSFKELNQCIGDIPQNYYLKKDIKAGFKIGLNFGSTFGSAKLILNDFKEKTSYQMTQMQFASTFGISGIIIPDRSKNTSEILAEINTSLSKFEPVVTSNVFKSKEIQFSVFYRRKTNVYQEVYPFFGIGTGYVLGDLAMGTISKTTNFQTQVYTLIKMIPEFGFGNNKWSIAGRANITAFKISDSGELNESIAILKYPAIYSQILCSVKF
jgi:hypothetical protein